MTTRRTLAAAFVVSSLAACENSTSIADAPVATPAPEPGPMCAPLSSTELPGGTYRVSAVAVELDECGTVPPPASVGGSIVEVAWYPSDSQAQVFLGQPAGVPVLFNPVVHYGACSQVDSSTGEMGTASPSGCDYEEWQLMETKIVSPGVADVWVRHLAQSSFGATSCASTAPFATLPCASRVRFRITKE